MRYERCINLTELKKIGTDETIKHIMETAKHRNAGYVHVIIENIKMRRTTGPKSQNKHFNGHVQQIAMELGWTFEDCKKYIKQQAVGMGYPILYRNGVAVYDPWGNVMGISERDSSTEECAILIEAAHMFAADNNIILREE